MAGTRGAGVDEAGRTTQDAIISYGPHACEVCGITIIKAAREQGGEELEPPARLMEIYVRGSMNSNPHVVYPMTWTPHMHREPFLPPAEARPPAPRRWRN